MTALVARYREHLSSTPSDRSERLFAERLARFRRGDESGWREISGSYLLLVLDWVESLPELPNGLAIDDAIQESNAGLVDAIHSFTGATSDEFWMHAQRTMFDRMNAIDDEQEPTDGQENCR